MYTKLTTISILAFAPLFLLSQKNETNTLSGFLRLNAVEVEFEDIRSDTKFFLNTNFDKKSNDFFWFKGSLKSIFEDSFSDLNLKFNTINNSLYVKKGKIFYKVSSAKVESFILFDKGLERVFLKGFGLHQISTIVLTYDILTSELLKHLLLYERFDQLEITELVMNKQQGELTIKLNTALRGPIYELVKHMSRKSGISDVKLKSSDLEVNENTFFEIMFDGELFLFLKHNYKKISQTESVSLVNHSQSHIFEKNIYYFSNRNHEIIGTIFTRRSIENSLAFTGIERKVPPLGNEVKLVKWLNENFKDR